MFVGHDLSRQALLSWRIPGDLPCQTCWFKLKAGEKTSERLSSCLQRLHLLATSPEVPEAEPASPLPREDAVFVSYRDDDKREVARRALMRKAFKACRPLSDPARVTAITLIFIVAGLTLPFFVVGFRHPLAVVPICILLSIRLFFGASFGRPVFYLRAFRSDVQARPLHAILKATLGNRYRLCGIRPPAQRAGLLARVFLSYSVALRYVGSPSFDLEAQDENWQARLLASYDRACFAFLDLPDTTTHVADELRLSYLAFGASRCVCIVDASRPRSEWATFIAEILGAPLETVLTMPVAAYTGDSLSERREFVSSVSAAIASIRGSRVGVNESALSFARERVSESAWKTPWLHSAFGQLVAGLFVTNLVIQGTAMTLYEAGIKNAVWVQNALQGILAVALLYYFGGAFGRLFEQGLLEKRLTGCVWALARAYGAAFFLIVAAIVVAAKVFTHVNRG
jgi:hypothetical protein